MHIAHGMLRRAIVAVAVRMCGIQIRHRRLSRRHMVLITIVAVAVRMYGVEVWSRGFSGLRRMVIVVVAGVEI